MMAEAQKPSKTVSSRHPWPQMYLEPETELSVCVLIQSILLLPRRHVRSIALMLIAKNCPPGRKQKASCHLPGPLVKRVSCTAWKVPPERFAFFFPLSLSLLINQVFWLLFLVPDLGTIYLFTERERGRNSALTILAWCVCMQSTGFPHCYLGKRESRC